MKLATGKLKTEDQTARLASVQDLGGRYAIFGTEVLFYADDADFDELAQRAGRDALSLDEIGSVANRDDMFLVIQIGRVFQQEHPGVPVLFDKGRFLVVEMSPEQVAELSAREGHTDFSIEPLEDNVKVFDVRAPGTDRVARVPWVQDMVNAVSGSEFEASLEHLVSFPTRYSPSLHYDQALNWARSQFDAMGYATTVQPLTFGNETTKNLIADRPGSGTGRRQLVVVCAHLDSISGTPQTRAPGADDNASGCAGAIEMARVLKEHDAVHDVRFILFGAEERGLVGSRKYVDGLPMAERQRIGYAVNMDMIASDNTPFPLPAVLIEGAEVSRGVIDDLASAAATYTSLVVQTSLKAANSDHVSLIKADIPCVLAIEGTDDQNHRVHTANDTLAHLDIDLAVEILRMNVAAVATALGKKGEPIVSDNVPLKQVINAAVSEQLQRTQLSGRYQYNGGVVARQAANSTEGSAEARQATIENPVYLVEEPIYLDSVDDSGQGLERSQGETFGFTLHIDIDGSYPLNVVSGTVVQDLPTSAGGSERAHFIGRVTSDTLVGGVRKLVVGDFSFQWPGPDASGVTIDRLEVNLPASFPLAPKVEVSFVATASSHCHGPYIAQQESTYFRAVEIEVDREDGAAEVEPYNTLTHSVRPADLPEEELTLESAFGKAGIRITRSSGGNVIDTAAAGDDKKWTHQELHDAMEEQFSAFANRPQWKMWVFLAEHHVTPGLGGVMFDANISAPDGVDRQGTALFTKNAYFHSPAGTFAKANPPEVEAVRRELFFNLVHETGHAFNLLHSFQKTYGTAYEAPSWMPVRSNAQALSFMNYGDQATPYPAGASAKWFYNQFRFRFDDAEHLFLRHAPEEFLQMGNAAWAQNHGRVARADLDSRLGLQVRGIKDVFEFGEPVFVKLTLQNKSNEELLAQTNLNPSEGSFVEIAVQNQDGRRPFVPAVESRHQVRLESLREDEVREEIVNLTVGRLGFSFTKPGMYRIEASYTNSQGGSAAAVTHVYVKEPNGENALAAQELFNARVGRALVVDGTRVMEDANERMARVENKLGDEHPVTFKLRYVRGLPYTRPFKRLGADRSRVLLEDPDERIVNDTLAEITSRLEVAAPKMGYELYSRAVRGQGNFLVTAGKTDEAIQLVGRTEDFYENERVAGRLPAGVLEDMTNFRNTLEERA